MRMDIDIGSMPKDEAEAILKEIMEKYRIQKLEFCDFGGALNALKSGKKIQREGWNGKGMYLYLEKFEDIDALYPEFEPCIVMFTAQGKHQPGWLASQADMLANDWRVLD